MKIKLHSAAALVLGLQMANAQFSIDPSQPMVVCNAANSQKNVQVLPDGSNGYYVFWTDMRNATQYFLYGQHLDSDGDPQWTANGRIIVQPGIKSIVSYKTVLFQGGILIAWIQAATSGYGDSLLCKQINFSGNDVWVQPTLVGQSGINSILYHETYNLNVIPNDSGAFINYSLVYIGGSSGIALNRIDNNGVLRWASPQTPVLPGYSFWTYSGLQNTFYSISRGNGLGSPINVQKFDLQCTAQWASTVDISLAISSNGFGGTHYLYPDSSGNAYVIWEGNAQKIFYSKLDSSGNFLWSPQIKATVSIASTQSRPHTIFFNNNLYILWNDDRISGQTTVFTQKYDSSGAELWTPNGVQTGVCNGYYDYPKIATSDSNSVLCAFHAGAPWFVYAQRIRSDGTLSWSGNGTALASNHAFINYDAITLTNSTNGCNAVFWIEFSTEDIYSAKICSDGNLVSIESPESDKIGFDIFPNPSKNYFTVTISGVSKVIVLEIYNVTGKLLYQETDMKNNSSFRFSNLFLSPGIYFVKAVTPNGYFCKKLIVE
jgi:hypothetical protein